MSTIHLTTLVTLWLLPLAELASTPLTPTLTESPQPPYRLIEDEAKLPLLTPELAERKVLKLRLENGLQLYLISDPHAEKSAAAMTVRVGSWDDPVNQPGLAHFLEHMLFMGTTKYPEENGYDRYISEHGGMTNAFTTNDTTSYLFSVDHKALEGALDRFSQFFKAPLLSASAVERELRAIDQEYAKNIEDDGIRLQHVLKTQVTPSHPEKRFQMGNSESLKEATPAVLRRFYDEHYSANLMYLVIYSALPLDQLKQLALRYFRDVANKELQPTQNGSLPYEPSYGGELLFVEPVQNQRILILRWLLPARFSKVDEAQPEKVVCHLLGDEGERSLLAQLKREELARELACGEQYYSKDIQELYLEIDLTEQGLKNYPLVIERVFQAIASFREAGLPKPLFEQMQQQQQWAYQYQERKDAFKEMMGHAMRIVQEELKSYPEKSLLLKKYQPQAVQSLLQLLTPERCRIAIVAPYRETRVKSTEKEPYLGVSYASRQALPSQYNRWQEVAPHPLIGLPDPNPFMPEQLELKEAPPLEVDKEVMEANRGVTPPKLLLDDARGKVYFLADRYYKVPKVAMRLVVRTPKVTPADPKSSAMNDLFLDLVKAELAETTYQAKLAGLSYKIAPHENGVKVELYGFDDKAPLLLQTIIERLRHLEVDQQQYRLYREALLRRYGDSSLAPPMEQAIERFKELFYGHFATDKEKESALRQLSWEEFELFSQELFRSCFLEGVLCGNLREPQASQLVQNTLTQLGGSNYPADEHYQRQLLLLPNTGPFYWREQIPSQGNALLLTIQGGEASYEKKAIQQIAVQAMREAFFDALRTKQQTAYLVLVTGEEVEGQLLDLFGVQSASHGGRDLLARFELFFEQFLKEVTELQISPARFDLLRQSTIEEWSRPPRELQEMAELLEKLAFQYDGQFDRPSQLVKGAEQLTYEVFIEELRRTFGNKNRRRLALILEGTDPQNAILRYQKVKSPSTLRQEGQFVRAP